MKAISVGAVIGISVPLGRESAHNMALLAERVHFCKSFNITVLRTNMANLWETCVNPGLRIHRMTFGRLIRPLRPVRDGMPWMRQAST